MDTGYNVVVGESGGLMFSSSHTWLLQNPYENITTKTTTIGLTATTDCWCFR